MSLLALGNHKCCKPFMKLLRLKSLRHYDKEHVLHMQRLLMSQSMPSNASHPAHVSQFGVF